MMTHEKKWNDRLNTVQSLRVLSRTSFFFLKLNILTKSLFLCLFCDKMREIQKSKISYINQLIIIDYVFVFLFPPSSLFCRTFPDMPPSWIWQDGSLSVCNYACKTTETDKPAWLSFLNSVLLHVNFIKL